MENFIEIHWTSGTLEEARSISQILVQNHYVACAQIVPNVESIYYWNQQVETAQESKIIFKTRLANYDKIRQVIEENSEYEVPEITWFKIEGGNKAYIDWLRDSSQGPA